MMDIREIAAIVFLIVVLMVMGGFLGYSQGVEATKKEAVLAGAAVWVADENGEAKIEWRKP